MVFGSSLAGVAANSAELFLTPSEWDCWWAEGGDVARAGLGWSGLGTLIR